MAIEKQTAANRLNAQKSTGPRSPEGRAAVRLNGVTPERVETSLDTCPCERKPVLARPTSPVRTPTSKAQGIS